MGHIRTSITLRNPRLPGLGPVIIEALVDTGAVTLCIPQSLAERLQLDLGQGEPRTLTLADGSLREVTYSGPVEVSFGDRKCYSGTLVMGDEVLLGAIQMEDLDLVLIPSRREVIANPVSPHHPWGLAKRSAA
jgi:clan AA aspartic protease